MGDKENKECCSKFKYMAVATESTKDEDIGLKSGIKITLRFVEELNPENNFLKGKLVKFCPICGNELEIPMAKVDTFESPR